MTRVAGRVLVPEGAGNRDIPSRANLREGELDRDEALDQIGADIDRCA